MIPADLQQLPDDVDALKAMIAAAHSEIAELKVINATSDERIARLTVSAKATPSDVPLVGGVLASWI